MARLRVKCLQVGLIIGFGAFLISNVKPLPLPEVEPQLTAGAAKFPLVVWQTTKIEEKEVIQEVAEVATVAIEAPEMPVEAVEVPVDEPVDETVDETHEVIEQADDLLYRVVQAEGYTMGYEGMRLITDAILNLARDRGCSVDDVLTSGAYTVVNTGAIWRQSLYQETIDAVNAELSGQIDYEIKYFRTGHYHGFGNPCFSYGNVYFSS